MSKDTENLTRSLKNDRNNKDLLRTEINNATDPNVRLELTKMLVELEREEKKKKATKWISLAIILFVILLSLLYLGNKSPKESPVTKKTNISSSSTKQTETSETTEEVVKETNLSEDELKKWVMAVLDLTPPPPTKYILKVRVDDTDKLAYIHVGIDQLDGAGTFRVNAKGQLEYLPRMGQATGSSQWILMSDKYMDTSLAEKYYEEQSEKQTKDDDDLNKIKNQLIGKKYVIKPILYDGIDAEQAMNDHKAPQSLIHDGVQPVTFTNDTTVHIELAGTYRPDYDETYTINSKTINLKDYYIPYTFNNDSFTFDTWTTDIDGHTVTWAMTPQ